MSRRRPSAVDLLAAAGPLADAHLDRLALDVLEAMADASRKLAGRADEHDVRDVDGRGAVDDPAGRHLGRAHPVRVANRARLLVSLHDVEVLDDDLAVAWARVEDAALLAAVLAAQHLNDV